MSGIFTDSVSSVPSLAASVRPAAKSALSSAFADQLGGEEGAGEEETGKELPAIAGSDYGMYANVVVNGKVVASLSNSGCCVIADGYGGPAWGDALDMPGDGPALAQQRAEKIAQALGGTVEKLSTAQTPEQWKGVTKKVGMIDLWSLEGNEPPGYHPQLPNQALDVFLREQETVDTPAG